MAPRPPHRIELDLRRQVASVIQDEIAARELTQAQVREILNIAQPDVSYLKNGKVERFSLSQLIAHAEKLGITLSLSMTSSRA
ncbi:XRE family transcriptional regulator [Nocardia sp. NPDC050435]|uniref:helix-turn-helix domain-containing protein n=1 Tax=Nocardia sp. NPDC050435 TaxID=3155040 RepID=UPI0033E13B48